MARGARRLKDRIAFDQPAEFPDGSFGNETGWAERFVRFGEFIYQRGSEAVEAARLEGQSVYKLKVRSDPETRSLTAGWRARDVLRQSFDTQGKPKTGVYNIREVDPITDRQWVYLVVESGVAT